MKMKYQDLSAVISIEYDIKVHKNDQSMQKCWIQRFAEVCMYWLCV